FIRANTQSKLSNDATEMHAFAAEIEQKVSTLCCQGGCYDGHVISTGDVRLALSKVKMWKVRSHGRIVL
ncbi:MAG: hypothetical protein V2I33_20595, partial [Kangiellaceae bacterium]|nr:hypothetical protein [Kangiellaceae bacterium]